MLYNNGNICCNVMSMNESNGSHFDLPRCFWARAHAGAVGSSIAARVLRLPRRGRSTEAMPLDALRASTAGATSGAGGGTVGATAGAGAAGAGAVGAGAAGAASSSSSDSPASISARWLLVHQLFAQSIYRLQSKSSDQAPHVSSGGASTSSGAGDAGGPLKLFGQSRPAVPGKSNSK